MEGFLRKSRQLEMISPKNRQKVTKNTQPPTKNTWSLPHFANYERKIPALYWPPVGFSGTSVSGGVTSFHQLVQKTSFQHRGGFGRCQIAMFVAHVRILIVWYAMSLALGSAMSLALKVWPVVGAWMWDLGHPELGVDRVLMDIFS